MRLVFSIGFIVFAGAAVWLLLVKPMALFFLDGNRWRRRFHHFNPAEEGDALLRATQLGWTWPLMLWLWLASLVIEVVFTLIGRGLQWVHQRSFGDWNQRRAVVEAARREQSAEYIRLVNSDSDRESDDEDTG